MKKYLISCFIIVYQAFDNNGNMCEMCNSLHLMPSRQKFWKTRLNAQTGTAIVGH